MTKELSKQLCELCGVEGKIKKQELTIVNGEIIDKFEYRIYPDFGKPSNFVKLLELSIPKSWTDGKETLTTHVNQSSLGWKNRSDYLWAIEFFVNPENFTCNEEQELGNQIKQAIKETQWEY